MKNKENSRQAPKLKAFVLEPILTPSGLPIDVGEETTDLSTQNVDLVDDLDIDVGTEAYIDETLATEIDNVTFISELPSNIDFCDEPFTSGVFTVGDSGEVTVDFLFDGGRYEGELAIFSLDGMDEFEPGSEEFIQEAARRALSDSELGHIVIRDRTEGARFSGYLGEAKDWNQDNYLGAKTFQMRSGDEFGVMLVPNSTVENVFENPDVSGRQTPLFSMSTANPNDAFHVGQLVDVTGDGNTFVLEDQRIDLGSDKDYNDLIFQVRGATGKATLLDEVVDPADDWRNTTDLGQALVEYAEPYITPEVDEISEPAPTIDQTDPSVDIEIPEESAEIAPVPLPPNPADQPLIGIIDTGFNRANPDIDYTNVALGSDLVDGDSNPLLTNGEGNEHGTHVLGIIAAERDNGIGIDGVNDDAPIWLGRGVGAGNWAESLIEYVDTFSESDQLNGVVNLSMDLTQIDAEGNITTRYELTPAERAAIEYARQEGILIVVSAGNDNGIMSALGQASQEFDNIITVGAAKRFIENPNVSTSEAYLRTEYSSYGYGLDIVAEGGTVQHPVLSTIGEDVDFMSGTSVAAAKVTGAVSQVWAANPNLSYRQVIDLLKDTATDLSTSNWDPETGAGLLNIAAAVNLAKATRPNEHTAPMSWIPDTWSGAGVFVPAERAVQIYSANFNGQVIATVDAYLRSGPSTSHGQVGSAAYGTQLNYDAWTEGEFISYPSLGTADDRWYRIAGTNHWISAAITTGQPHTLTPTPTPTPAGYYPQLAGLSDAQWNDYTKDNTRFDVGWPDYRDERHLTPESIRNIYTDLSMALFGKRHPVTAGYLLDPGYRQGIGKWHSGLDIDTPNGESVRAIVSGTTILIQDKEGDYFIGVQADDGKLWIYGHLGSHSQPIGSRIEAGQVIGTIGSIGSHLHLEVQQGPNYQSSQSANLNTVQNATLNPIKAFWELKNANSISGGGSSDDTDNSSQPALPGQQMEYRVKAGDTLWDIARRYLGSGNRWREIMKSPNGETFTEAEARTLAIGRSVYIPVSYVSGGGGTVMNPPTNGNISGMTPYVVGSLGLLDDTLWEIAERKLGSGFRWTEIRGEDGTTFTSDEARRIARGTTVYLPISGTPPTSDPALAFEAAKKAAIERAGGSGVTGYPISSAQYINTDHGNGWIQKFRQPDGRERWISLQDGSNTAFWIKGDNLKEFERLGGFWGVLGFPLNDETEFVAGGGTGRGIWQGFSGSNDKARIHNSWITENGEPAYVGSVATWGSIGSLYTDMGGASSWLGVPTKSEWSLSDNENIWTRFEDGWIAHNNTTNQTEAFSHWDRPSWIKTAYKQEFTKYLQFAHGSNFFENPLYLLSLGHTTWNISANEMLQKYSKLITLAALYYGVSGQAIAGVIRWEYEENRPSRQRDDEAFVKVTTTGNWTPFNGTGWGKMHYSTAKKVLQEEPGLLELSDINDNALLAKILALPFSSIDLIAREMRHAAKAYDSEGSDIYQNPGVLATLYRNGEDDKSYEDKAREAREDGRKPRIEQGEIDVNDWPLLEENVEVMGSWVYNKVQDGDLQSFQTFDGELEVYDNFVDVSA